MASPPTEWISLHKRSTPWMRTTGNTYSAEYGHPGPAISYAFAAGMTLLVAWALRKVNPDHPPEDDTNRIPGCPGRVDGFSACQPALPAPSLLSQGL